MMTTADLASLLSKNALTVLKRRYLKRDQDGRILEDPADMFRRVADAVADAETRLASGQDATSLADRFYDAMTCLEFLPNSPTLMNAGRELGQLSACFVLPVDDSMESIFEAIKQTALIHKSGGGTGFSFSRIRPANDVVLSTKGVSSGPISFMKVFDAATETIKQGGTRRGANMGILRVDHPDIMDFIMVKKDLTVLTNFNLSVGLTEAFMKAVEEGQEYDLLNPRTGEPLKKLDARKVFDRIIDMAWTSGEPGIIFLDRLNRDNPTPHVGEIEATNPCGEQPLLPYESCNLGSINLSRMVTGDGEVDWEKLRDTVQLGVRFLDNVIEINRYPLPQISEMTLSNRKIGLGIMGWADMLILLGLPYNSSQAIALADKLMNFITTEARATSVKLAEQRGAFPNFPGSSYDQAGDGPLRNATCTTIAPTGTISIIANTSSGVEPIFAVSYIRQVMDNDVLVEVHPLFEAIAHKEGFYSPELMKAIAEKGTIQGFDEIPEKVRKLFVTAHDITPEDHIHMQAAFQKHTDNAVSKTVNFPHSATREEVAEVYRLAYKEGCKGVTIYRDGSRDMQVLSVAKAEEKPEEPAIPVESGKSGHKRERPRALTGKTYQMSTGCGPLYVTINQDNSGLFELFTTMGKAGGCAASQCEAIGRLVSLAWRSGVQARQVVKQLIGITCHKPAGFGENRVTSCADAVARAILTHMQMETDDDSVIKTVNNGGACPECGGPVEHEGGCCVCHACGYSECA
ncbi:ribonucleoside diphosphate reductase, adenosylcobalamin-dependent [Syntrophotalea carbinolica DSM 2380]|uniref:Vitamin B12-dependent ribonucleotide reductase n=1 Tax=Syntrophotalea carbinolica (strain DSM 2380 / NBRC 103641 / GraBd1) TaxID=338963 RepID=Q3A3G4_SYNC1|nr:vitamin B12-dependent ribonucleotide reductase [Syntrophotalea carbinolica]ABA89093.1 ribonucleoside diphosphate reductase, adenosylcobalamin-dependent [Syntrophotalea carbinolica DSM 2380]